MFRTVKAPLLLLHYLRSVPRLGRVCMHKVTFVVVKFSMTYRVLHMMGLVVRYHGFLPIRVDDLRILQLHAMFSKESAIIILEQKRRFYPN